MTKENIYKAYVRSKTLRGGNRGNHAFTLIELLVVVLIIGVLSAVALPQYQKAVHKARMAEVAVRLKALGEAVELYVLENGFPASGEVYLEDVNPDLFAGMTETSTNSHLYMASKHTAYGAICNSSGCHINAMYNYSGNQRWSTAEAYALDINRNYTKAGGWQTGKCYYFAPGDKYASTVCSVLPGYVAEPD